MIVVLAVLGIIALAIVVPLWGRVSDRMTRASHDHALRHEQARGFGLMARSIKHGGGSGL